jgi:hypothetical protein
VRGPQGVDLRCAFSDHDILFAASVCKLLHAIELRANEGQTFVFVHCGRPGLHGESAASIGAGQAAASLLR